MNLLHVPEKVWQSQSVPFNKFKCAVKNTENYISKNRGLLFCFIEMVDDFLIILILAYKKVQNIKH